MLALTLIVKGAGTGDLHSALSGGVWMALEHRQIGGSFSHAGNISSLQSFLSQLLVAFLSCESLRK